MKKKEKKCDKTVEKEVLLSIVNNKVWLCTTDKKKYEKKPKSIVAPHSRNRSGLAQQKKKYGLA